MNLKGGMQVSPDPFNAAINNTVAVAVYGPKRNRGNPCISIIKRPVFSQGSKF